VGTTSFSISSVGKSLVTCFAWASKSISDPTMQFMRYHPASSSSGSGSISNLSHNFPFSEVEVAVDALAVDALVIDADGRWMVNLCTSGDS